MTKPARMANPRLGKRSRQIKTEGMHRPKTREQGIPSILTLPAPRTTGQVPLEAALARRRSVRTFAGGPVTLAEVSQLLWAAQGTTHPDGKRTAPSAGGLYPLEVYLIAGDVTGLSRGFYHYLPKEHGLNHVGSDDRRLGLSTSSLGQSWVAENAAVIVIAADVERTTARYGERGMRYVSMEVGHAAQNIALQAVSLGLGTVLVAAFHDENVTEVLGLPRGEQPLALIPIGKVP